MSDSRSRGRSGGRGHPGRGGRGASTELPFRQGPPPGRGGSDSRGRGGGRGDPRGRGGFSRGASRGGRDLGPRIHSQGGQAPSLDSRVMKTENETAKSLATKHQKSHGQPRYPERPGYGTLGQQVALYANYFQLQSVGKELFRYSLDVSGDPSGRKPTGKKLRQTIRLLLDEHFLQYQNSVTTDYKSNLISRVELPEGQYDVRYRDEQEDDYPEKPTVYRLRCQFTGKLSPSDLVDYLTSTKASAIFQSSQAEILQAMNIVLGHEPKSDPSIASVGANRHFSLHPDSTERYDLGAGLEVLRGFFVSVRAATTRLLVNVQVKYAACYQKGPLGGIISEYQRNSRDVYRLDAFLKRLRIRVTHIVRKSSKGRIIPRMKTIAGLASTADGRSSLHPPRVPRHGAGPRDVEFFLESAGQSQPSSGKKGKKPSKAGPSPAGQYISVADFFRREYNRNVNPDVPVVNVGNRENPSYLPVEVCEVEPGQPAKSKLSPNQTRNMLNFAVRAPAQNAQSIVTKGAKVLGGSSFGIQPNPSLVTVPGRVLQAPRVFYKDKKSAQKQIDPLSGSWNMKAVRFTTPTRLASWTWLYIDSKGARSHWASPQELNGTLQAFVDKLNDIGVATGPPSTPGKKFTLTGTNHEGEIDGAVEELMGRADLSLILTILPSNDAAVYNCVKLVCDVRRGVRNVNVLAEKLKGANDQYFANVGLKFNLKLGGANQSLKSSELGLIADGGTMLVGIDVTHPSPGSASDAPSIAGIVSSVDSSLAQWPAEIKIQESRQEMVSSLDSMFKTRLQRWTRSNNNYPENIIVYRDGVSEGQYDIVIDKELPLLKKACAEMYPAAQKSQSLPRISIVIVGKRHNTRFYPTREEDADRSNNTKNGTVVDRGVTEARNWDFYLQAHTALKGTARPAHYFTVWDEVFQSQPQKGKPPTQSPADVLENLTHRMCYLFGRATKAVSICPPAYYADLVCERARCYLSHLFDPSPQATPAGSVVSGAAGRAADARDAVIHPNVRDTMFYI